MTRCTAITRVGAANYLPAPRQRPFPIIRVSVRMHVRVCVCVCVRGEFTTLACRPRHPRRPRRELECIATLPFDRVLSKHVSTKQRSENAASRVILLR